MRNLNIFDYNFMYNRREQIFECMEQFNERNNINENMWFILLFMLNDDDMIQLNYPFNSLNPYQHISSSSSSLVLHKTKIINKTKTKTINDDIDTFDTISINTNILDNVYEDHYYVDGEITPPSSISPISSLSLSLSRSSSPLLSISRFSNIDDDDDNDNNSIPGVITGTVSTYSSSSSLSTMGEARTFEEIKENKHDHTQKNMKDYYSYYIYSYLHPVYSYVKEKTTELPLPETNKLTSIKET